MAIRPPHRSAAEEPVPRTSDAPSPTMAVVVARRLSEIAIETSSGRLVEHGYGSGDDRQGDCREAAQRRNTQHPGPTMHSLSFGFLRGRVR
jgi:hypothetical protein